MKNSTFLAQSLIASGLLFAFSPAKAQLMAWSQVRQRTEMSPDQQEVKSLRSVLKELENHYKVSFTYDKSTVADKKVPSNLAHGGSIQIELSNILRTLDLDFEQLSQRVYLIRPGRKQIVPVQPKQEAIASETPGMVASSLISHIVPKQTISGTVTDKATGDVLPGVSVLIKGTTQGTSTDASGKFSLQSDDRNVVLIFSYVGYKAVELATGSQTALNVSLEADTKSLNEVVVTALGISREKSSLGYAVGTISGKDMQRVPQENVLNALTGKVAGLKISNTGNDLNAETQVVIRGKTSLAGMDSPLIVVDGIPVGSDAGVIADLNASNIENISVLKGPSAAALYGSRAGSGVLLITTKSGEGAKKGIGVTFNSGYTASKPYRFMEQQHRFTNGKNGQFNESDFTYWFGPEEGTNAVQWNSDGVATPLKFYPDNLKNFFQTGNSFITDVGIQGAYDKGSFRLSFSDTRATGNRPGMELTKNAFDLAATYKLTKKFVLSTNVHVLNSNSDNFAVQIGSDYPNEAIFFVPNHVNVLDLKDYWLEKNVRQRTIGADYLNPWFGAQATTNRFDRVRVYGNVKLDWQLTDHLSLMGRFGNSKNNTESEHIKPYSHQDAPQGYYNFGMNYSQETNADFLLSYKREIRDLSVNVSVGGNALYLNTTGLSAGGQGLTLPGLYTASNVLRTAVSYGNGFSKKVVYSAYGVASLGYKNAVYLDVTGRNDWSSTLPANNRSYFYPSASLSLVVSNMLSMPSAISLLKLRGGWAQVGKDTDPYATSQILTRSTWGNDVQYARPTTMPNVNLKPENAVSTELGFDLSMFRKRASLSATVYKVANKNQILGVTIPGITGYTAAQVNAGIVENRGMEIELRATPIAQKDFSWDLNVNFTKDRSKLKQLVDGMDTFTFWSTTQVFNRTRVGENIGDLYGYDVLRVKDGEYAGWPLLDANGKTQRGTELQKIGNVISDFMIGLQTTVNYKSFSLSASFDWREGGDYYSMTMLRMARSGNIENWKSGISSSTFSGILGSNSFDGNADQLANEIKTKPEIYRDNYVYVGGRTQELGGFLVNGNYNGTFFPGVISDGKGGFNENFGAAGTKYVTDNDIIEPGSGWWDRATSMWVYDASFVKLREIALSYNVPASVSGLIRAQNLSLSIFARNLMVWNKAKTGIDPELTFNRPGGAGTQMAQGWDRWNAAPWTALFGLKLSAQF